LKVSGIGRTPAQHDAQLQRLKLEQPTLINLKNGNTMIIVAPRRVQGRPLLVNAINAHKN
jgi:hypothetical protein